MIIIFAGSEIMPNNKDTIAAIDVKMFGEFSISINGKTITDLKGRTKRVWLLIQYLILNRNNTVNIEQIVRDIWDGQPCGDPENALKNLIYRARIILKTLSGKNNVQFILFMNGTYAWNNRYDFTADFELFDRTFNEANNRNNSIEKRIYYYQRTLELYRSGFLPKSSYSKWVVARAARYDEEYVESAKRLCGILMRLKKNREVISICKSALNKFPFDESLRKLLIAAYVNTGQRDNAFRQYNDTLKLYYDEYGIDMSSSFGPYYGKLTNSSFAMAGGIDVIKKGLKEDANVRGAYFCDYDIFKCIYRAQSRIIARTGQPVFLLLFTLSDKEGSRPLPAELENASNKLREIIITSLRRGDIIAPYSVGQFIVMVSMASYEHVKGIINRIIKKFKFDYRKKNIEANVKIAPME